eukprot:1157625-Pelagomonas_calceolata.AAC.7
MGTEGSRESSSITRAASQKCLQTAKNARPNAIEAGKGDGSLQGAGLQQIMATSDMGKSSAETKAVLQRMLLP